MGNMESRPLFTIAICKGDVRSSMMAIPSLATITLATPESTFGLPDVKLGGLPAVMSCLMGKRVADDDIRHMLTTGEPINARTAQQIGLVDFVGDVEVELARLIYRHCQPKVEQWYYRPDVEKIWDKE